MPSGRQSDTTTSWNARLSVESRDNGVGERRAGNSSQVVKAVSTHDRRTTRRSCVSDDRRSAGEFDKTEDDENVDRELYGPNGSTNSSRSCTVKDSLNVRKDHAGEVDRSTSTYYMEEDGRNVNNNTAVESDEGTSRHGKDTSRGGKDSRSSRKDISRGDKVTNRSDKDTGRSDKDISSSGKDTSRGAKDTSMIGKDISSDGNATSRGGKNKSTCFTRDEDSTRQSSSTLDTSGHTVNNRSRTGTKRRTSEQSYMNENRGYSEENESSVKRRSSVICGSAVERRHSKQLNSITTPTGSDSHSDSINITGGGRHTMDSKQLGGSPAHERKDSYQEQQQQNNHEGLLLAFCCLSNLRSKYCKTI